MSNITSIRLSGIIEESIVDGPGIRYVVFTQGCQHKCKGCHNPSTHDIHGGYLKKIDEIVKEIRNLAHIDGVTISGGEPFLQAESVANLIGKIKKDSSNLNIIIYTGYEIKYLQEVDNKYINNILNKVDIIIDGKYIEEERSLEIPFVGSKNQKVIPLTNLGRRLINEFNIK